MCGSGFICTAFVIDSQYALIILTQLPYGTADRGVDVDGLDLVLVCPIEVCVRAFAFEFDGDSSFGGKIVDCFSRLPTILLWEIGAGAGGDEEG